MIYSAMASQKINFYNFIDSELGGAYMNKISYYNALEFAKLII